MQASLCTHKFLLAKFQSQAAYGCFRTYDFKIISVSTRASSPGNDVASKSSRCVWEIEWQKRESETGRRETFKTNRKPTQLRGTLFAMA